MNQATYDIPLHDIKPIVEIEEYSLYYLIALNAVLILLIMAFIYLFIRWFKAKRRFNLRKEHSKILRELDLSDTKAAAYALSFYGATFKGDTPRHTKVYEEMFESLSAYKYKKDVTAFSEQTLHFIEIYRGLIDE